jgi:N-acetylglucosamine-6-phosphate deacetylase
VTTFCPTTVACPGVELRRVLAQVRAHRAGRIEAGARVHGAHLESNFINPVMKGAQPAEYIYAAPQTDSGAGPADEILSLIAEHRDDVAIVTVAPEIPRGLELVRRLTAMNILVSLGHSAADYAVANAAFDAGARHVTHLFNRMLPLGHREPGLAGAVLSRNDVTAEMICDAHHVHPSVVRLAIAAKGADAVVAISDGTAGAGLPHGACAKLGGRRITVGSDAAYLDEGTLAGSTLTMDGAFRMLVDRAGQSIVAAAAMCATSPARALRLDDRGAITIGLLADLVVLDRQHRVAHTCVSGRVVHSRDNGGDRGN